MTVELEPNEATLEPRSVISVDPDDPLGDLKEGLAPLLPEVVRGVRRDKAREVLFGRPVARQLGRYVVLGELGRGGMGTVLTAYDPQLDRKVALKLLHDPGLERHAKRLEREAKALAKLSHPNVVQVYEVGLADEQRFVAMELVHGQTLRRWQAERRPWKACVEVYRQAGRGLAAAHAKGLVHRDFKPGNCILDEDGRVRVLDFGLVYRSGDGEDSSDTPGDPRQPPTSGSSSSGLTKTGAVLGTPAYMPPEQLEGRRVDTRGDQFSFCAALYEALNGERPFEGESVGALLSAAKAGRVRPPSEGMRVPPKLRRVLVRGLAAEPDDRWPSMEALLTELDRLVAPRARRWVLLSLAVGVLGVGGGFALGQVADEIERCADAGRRLTNIWDEGRRPQVREAMLGTQVSYAPRTWERVEQQLDDYAAAWASKYTEVCEESVEDTQGEEDRRLRLDCLHERSRALRGVVDVLSGADAEVMEHAVELTMGLPGLERCDDLDALRAVVPPPEDPETRRRVDALREELASIDAAVDANNGESSLESVESLVKRAEALDYGPLIAEAKALLGSLHHAEGRYALAEQAWLEAHQLAMEHRHDAVALEATQSLTAVVGDRQARYAEGVVWGRAALGHAERSGEQRALAVSLGHLGGVLRVQGEYEQAQRHHERAVRIWEQSVPADDPDLAVSLGLLSATLAARSEYERAQQLAERALGIWERTLGSDHPKVGLILDNLGVMLSDQGQNEEARLHQERALRIREAALGADHPDVARGLNNLGITLRRLGKYEQAKLHHERALRVQQQAFGLEHPSVALSLDNLGAVLAAQGEYESAKLHHERALRVRERTQGPDHPDLVRNHQTLGMILLTQGHREEARIHIERALSLGEKALGPDHLELSYSLTQMGRVLAAQGDYEQARAHHERALEIRRDRLGADHQDVAESRHHLGNLWLSQGEYARAQAHYEQAQRIFDQTLGPEHPTSLTNLNNLGIVAQYQQKYDEARVHWGRVLASWEKSLGADHPSLAYPLVGLAEVALVEEDFQTARVHAERAVAIRQSKGVAPKSLALAQFVLARALWSDREQRARARSLAEHARDGFAKAGKTRQPDVAEVDRWLAEHPESG